MKAAWILAGLFLAAPVLIPTFGQTAKVVALTPEDAAKAKALYAEQARVEENIAQLRDRISMVYLDPGWFTGFEFSEDFKYIVPASQPLPSVTNGYTWPICYGTGVTGSITNGGGITTFNGATN